ncbi:hypothetical protein ACUXST_000311 [Sphingomonas sp. F9_3S_D5_B_2]
MDTKVISRMRTAPVWIGIFAIIVLAAYVIRRDLHGNGLQETLLFKVAGNFAFVIFYGCAIAAVISQFLMFRWKDNWLTVSNGTISVGSQRVSLSEVSNVEVLRNGIGLKELVLHRVHGRDFKTKVYLLARPLGQVVAALKVFIIENEIRNQRRGR